MKKALMSHHTSKTLRSLRGNQKVEGSYTWRKETQLGFVLVYTLQCHPGDSSQMDYGDKHATVWARTKASSPPTLPINPSGSKHPGAFPS